MLIAEDNFSCGSNKNGTNTNNGQTMENIRDKAHEILFDMYGRSRLHQCYFTLHQSLDALLCAWSRFCSTRKVLHGSWRVRVKRTFLKRSEYKTKRHFFCLSKWIWVTDCPFFCNQISSKSNFFNLLSIFFISLNPISLIPIICFKSSVSFLLLDWKVPKYNCCFFCVDT